MNKKGKHIEIRSNEVQDILGSIPSRIIRYGVLAVFVVFLLIFIGSWVFQYPDIIYSKIEVTTERPPATIVARASGKIEKLLVVDNQKVKKGAIIALIENPANYDDVLELKKQVGLFEKFLIDFNRGKQVEFNKYLQLGSIQDEYSQFIKAYNDYSSFLNLDYYPRLNKSLEKQRNMSKIYYDRLWVQRGIMENDYQLTINKTKRDSTLFASGVISLFDYEKSKSEMLLKKREFEEVRTSLAKIQMGIIGLDQKIIENQKNHQDKKTRLELNLNQAYINLSGAISHWELSYVLKAPIDGTVTFNKFWSENQNVKEGDRVLTIIPDDAGELVGRVKLPIRGSGKVKPGLRVNIKFDNYPYMEYGMVKGIVKNISLVPENNFYMVEIGFPNGLVTNYGYTLKLQNQIVGNAEIVTEELRLIQRFFNPLKALWKERLMKE